MKVIQLREQLPENTPLSPIEAQAVLPFIEDGRQIVYSVKRGADDNALCFKFVRNENEIFATGSYFVGIDWLREKDLAIQVSPKMNDGFEVDYVRMLNDALCEPENYEHLQDLLTIRFDKPSIRIKQQQDLLSIFLITEYLNMVQRIVRKGLKRDYYIVEENLRNKVKGRMQISRNIRQNLVNGNVTDNVCSYQIYDIDSPENRILKMALRFCVKQLEVYRHAIDVSLLEKKIRFVTPYFANVGDDVALKTIKTYKGNPVFREYNQAITFAQLLLRRYSYDISVVGKNEIDTPPFWIDMSKLFELYVFHHLRQVFKGRKELQYHVHAHHQELDYLLNPEQWPEPYVIDAKYKPYYRGTGGINKDDARQVAGYARLSAIYKKLGLDEDKALPIKCLIIYPDQDAEDKINFTRSVEPSFDKVNDYVRFYKFGIKLPIVNNVGKNV